MASVLTRLLLVAAGILVVQIPPARGPADPFAFLAPTITFSPVERRTIDAGQVYVRMLPSRGQEIALVAVAAVNVTGDRLVAWVREIAKLKKSRLVLGIGRFSDPPRLDDLAALTLDQKDFDNIRRCQPGDCGLKLAATEIAALRQQMAGPPLDWNARVEGAIRGVMLRRAQTYLDRGQSALSSPADRSHPPPPQTVFSSLVAHSEYLTKRLPAFAEYLTAYPRIGDEHVESFLYWSKEQVGGRPVISITHVNILRNRAENLPDALVAGKQTFATHYMNGALSLTAILRGRPGPPHYLTYINRTDVDVLGGFFGGVARMIIERRLTAEAAEAIKGLRERLESGEPRIAESSLQARASAGPAR
jgi:hypothetical protein